MWCITTWDKVSEVLRTQESWQSAVLCKLHLILLIAVYTCTYLAYLYTLLQCIEIKDRCTQTTYPVHSGHYHAQPYLVSLVQDCKPVACHPHYLHSRRPLAFNNWAKRNRKDRSGHWWLCHHKKTREMYIKFVHLLFTQQWKCTFQRATYRIRTNCVTTTLSCT